VESATRDAVDGRNFLAMSPALSTAWPICRTTAASGILPMMPPMSHALKMLCEMISADQLDGTR
jgi:hypothetical protein